MSNPRLLVITYYFPPHESVGALRWAGISKYLARAGWQVAVLAGAWPGDARFPELQWREACARLPTLVDGLRRLRRFRASSPSSAQVGGTPPGLAREIAALLSYPDESRGWMLRATVRARSLVHRFQPDIVVSSGPPHSAHLVAALATMGRRARWLADFRDPWAGPLGKGWEYHARFNSRVYQALSARLERMVCRSTDGIITNTSQLAEVMSAKYPGRLVMCIPNGVDAENLPARARDPYQGLSIAHAGTLYGGRDAGPIVRALATFLGRNRKAAPGTALRLAGEVESVHGRSLLAVIRETGMGDHVEMWGPVSRAKALELVSRSRLAVVLAQGQQLQVPAKLYESMAMGIPTLVIAEEGSAAQQEAERIGAVVRDPADINGIVQVMQQVWSLTTTTVFRCAVPITYQAMAPAIGALLQNAPASPAGVPAMVLS